MMDGKGAIDSNVVTDLYPVHFGISCALFTLKCLSQQGIDDKRWLVIREKILQGNAHLLGLLVLKVQRDESKATEKYELLRKLEAHQREIEELKRRRSEDAKANEKVVSIYAAQEQRWFSERKILRQHIGALLNDLRVLEKRNNEEISKLGENLQEMELLLKSKDNSLEEEARKRKNVEDKLKTLESVVEQLREASEQEARAHASELWKHKTAFLELVSNQRQLEAELGRAIRQAEAAKQQLDFVFEEKEESMLVVEKMSIEIEKLRKDSEQKDKILSAMLRKSKLDAAEKEMLLKEVKLSKAKKKQAELEIVRWKNVPKGRSERHTFRSMLSKQVSSRFGVFPSQRGETFLEFSCDEHIKPKSNDLGRNLDEIDGQGVDFSPVSNEDSPEGYEDLDMSADAKRVEDWVCLEAGKYQNAIEQRHHVELEAFSDQMRRKDEKLEAYHWRVLSMEVESKRLYSQIEDLNQCISQLRHNNMKLETLLMEKETELKSLKDQIGIHLNTLNSHQRSKSQSSRFEIPLVDDIVCSRVKVIKRTPAFDREQQQQQKEVKKYPVEVSKKSESENREEEPKPMAEDDGSTLNVYCEAEGDSEDIKKVSEDIRPQGGKEPSTATITSTSTGTENGEEVVEKEVTNDGREFSNKVSEDKEPWKMDINALGVSYKIKRLKQQLLMLERLAGKQGNGDLGGSDDHWQNKMKGFVLLLAVLNKQVSRYQSLQEKTDDLCKRMHEKDLNVKQGDATPLRSKEDSRMLEHFLEETFQLQRFIVATGQKLMEVQCKIVSGFIGISERLDGCWSFDPKRFSDSMQSLFKEVQRGLEVRIARIIGDLEGTLACDGIRSRRR